MKPINLKLNRNTKILLIITAVLITFFIADGLVFKNFRRRLSFVSSQIKFAQAQLVRDLNIQASKDKFKIEYLSVKPYLDIVSGKEDEAKAFLLREIERISRESLVTIVSLDPQDEVEDTKLYQKYKANLRLEMDFSQLTIFLSKLAESKFLIALDKMVVSSKDDTASVLKFDATASIIVPKTASKK